MILTGSEGYVTRITSLCLYHLSLSLSLKLVGERKRKRPAGYKVPLDLSMKEYEATQRIMTTLVQDGGNI